jgi:hypothetical protein
VAETDIRHSLKGPAENGILVPWRLAESARKWWLVLKSPAIASCKASFAKQICSGLLKRARTGCVDHAKGATMQYGRAQAIMSVE